MKKGLSLLLALVMVTAFLAGCTKTDSKPEAKSDETKAEATYADVSEGINFEGFSGHTPVVNGEIDTSEFVTVKMLVLGDPPAGGADERVFAELNRIFKEKLNAELEVTWIEWNNYETKYQMELVSGTPYDLIFTTSTWLNLWDNTEKGAFMDIKELLPYYAPNLYADTTAEEWSGCTYKGQIVALPEHRHWQLSTPVFIYRLDWAKEFGLDCVNSIDTLEQYCDGILANKPGVIPYNISGTVNSNELYAMWLRQETDYVLGPGSVGMSCPTANAGKDDIWTCVSPVFDDKFVDFAVRMKEWADKGYWPEDILSATIDGEAMFLAGKGGLLNCNVSGYYGMFEKMAKENPDAELDAFYFDEKRGFCYSDVMTQDSCSVTAAAQNPERALMMYDMFQYDPVVYHLTQYGIEGVQYIVNDEGYREKPESFNDETDSYYWDMWSTRNDSLEIPEYNEWQPYKDAINERIRPWTTTYPWGSFVYDTNDFSPNITAINEAGSTWLPAIQFGKAGDAKAAVEKYRDALTKAGITDYMADVERQMQEYLAN